MFTLLLLLAMATTLMTGPLLDLIGRGARQADGGRPAVGTGD